MGLRRRLVPRDETFFDILEKESTNVLLGATKLEDAMKSFDRMEERRKEFKDIEHAGDDIVHEIYERINRSSITPIDREDITKLAHLYDDVLDYMYAVTNKIVLYEVTGPTEAMINFAGLCRASVEQIHQAFISMRRLDKDEIDKRCIEVDRLENEADEVLNETVIKLFKRDDVISILKMKEIYENLEIVTDRCEDVSLVLRDILIKHK